MEHPAGSQPDHVIYVDEDGDPFAFGILCLLNVDHSVVDRIVDFGRDP